MPLMMLLLFFVCVLVLWTLFGWHASRGSALAWDGPLGRGPDDPTRSALQILNERSARGEMQNPD
jgi:uncharacterized membrane protein